MNLSHAASLHSCPAGVQAAGSHEARITLPDGGARRVFVSGEESIAGCRSMRLPVPLESIAGLRPLASGDPGETLFLHGPADGQGSEIESVSAAGSDSPPGGRTMPLREDLLAHLRLQTFGSEERAQAELADGRLRLHCGAGGKPAGVILRGPWAATRARADIVLQASGNGRFALQVLDEAAAARGEAHALGAFDAGAPARHAISLPPTRYDPAAWQGFVLVCPPDAASLQVDALRVMPRAGDVAGRSAWVWDARAWRERPQEVFAHAQRHALRTLFVSVPVREGRVDDPQALAAFIRRAGALGLSVWSVDGDAQMVLPQEHAPSAARVRAYADYNRSVEAAARLQGAQFDVEHYLLPGYELDAQAWDRRYLELARALHEAAGGLPLEFVMPFWWADKQALLQGLAPLASGLTVMDYRTRREEILALAQPFLDWGVRHGRRVRIALEAGPVAPERQHRFTRAGSGELWLLDFERTPVLLLLTAPRPNPGGIAYRRVSSRILDGSATTFHGDPGRLLRMLPELEGELSAWTSFGGIALHELK
ncbi:hypothetical protein [Noviherbaspirillum aridicola]|uniref:hypothetical protein n=1 Tax=Noviherbaspirillum aridicola TaxID=2849687 RepID=UPI001C81221F|nr:hypothetical protein [Noviherbaspirillum aridicola]